MMDELWRRQLAAVDNLDALPSLVTKLEKDLRLMDGVVETVAVIARNSQVRQIAECILNIDTIEYQLKELGSLQAVVTAADACTQDLNTDLSAAFAGYQRIVEMETSPALLEIQTDAVSRLRTLLLTAAEAVINQHFTEMRYPLTV